MSKILANQIANYGDDSPIELKEGLSIPVGKPLQAGGQSGSNGQVLSSTGTTVQWVDTFDGDYNSLSNRPTIPAAQIKADWNAVGTLAEILNKPIVPPQPGVQIAETPSGAGNLAYNTLSGIFTFTQPDLSSIDSLSVNSLTLVGSGDGLSQGNLEWNGNDNKFYFGNSYLSRAAGGVGWIGSSGDLFLSSNLGITITSEDGNTVYASIGGDNQGVVLRYDNNDRITTSATGVSLIGDLSLVSGTTNIPVGSLGDVDLTTAPTDGQVLKWEASSSSWKPANDDVGNTEQGILYTDLSVTTAAVGTAGLSYNNSNGVFTYTPPDLSDYDTAYGWGDHAQAGYLTSESDPVFSASDAAAVTAAKITNWDTAHGWGDHAQAGYQTALGTHITNITSTQVTNWDSAYGWGDHGTEGYLTDITGESVGNLSDVDTTTDAPTNGDVLSWNGTSWVPALPNNLNVAASVYIGDTPPSAAAGDLWWESDKGRLKVYYNDGDTSQWVDTNPPLAAPSSLSLTTTNGSNGINLTTNTSSSFTDGAIEFVTDNGTTSEVRWIIAPQGSLIPTTNAAYDFGSAEYKVRDLYLSSASDIRLKTDVVDYTGGLAFVESLRVVDFTWKEDVAEKAGKRETGLIAQEVKEALDASNYNSWRLHTDGDTQGLDREQLIPALISAIQELSARVKELENK